MKRLFCVLLALLMLFFTLVPAIAEDKQVYSKLSAEVKDTIKDMNSNEEVSVYVLLNDIDSDAVMDSFAKSFKGFTGKTAQHTPELTSHLQPW